jgi:hypothetical protein
MNASKRNTKAKVASVQISEPVVKSRNNLQFTAFTEKEVLDCELYFFYPTKPGQIQKLLPPVKELKNPNDSQKEELVQQINK